MGAKLNSKTYKLKLAEVLPNIKCIGEYSDCYTPTTHKCAIHNIKFDKPPYKVLSQRRQCSHGDDSCDVVVRRKRKTHEDYVIELSKKNPTIEVVDKFLTVNDNIKHKCLKCDNKWYASPNNILAGKGCRKCSTRSTAKLLMVPEKDHKAHIKAKFNGKVKLISPYNGARRRRRYSCGVCKNEWETTLCQGCPACAFHKKNNKRFKPKEYKLGRRTVLVQGFENVALDWLLENTTRKPKDITVASEGKVPVIKYRFNGLDRSHYPDMLITKTNGDKVIIEVKSTRTFGILYASDRPKVYYKNIAKYKAAKAQGYDYRFMVFDNKKQLLKLPSNWYELSPKKVADFAGIKTY